jgi:hypothetical protein
MPRLAPRFERTTRTVIAIGAFAIARSAWAEEPTRDGSISLRAGAYALIDRADRAFDGPEIGLEARVPFDRRWALTADIGAAGEFVGAHGTCLGELATHAGPLLTLRPGPEWLHVNAAAGAGLVFARMYGSLFGASDPMLTAYGDKVLPELWASLGVSVRFLTAWGASLDLSSRWKPPAAFHADHVPAGMRSDFYPTFRHPHDLSTLGGAVGLAYRF